MQQRSALLFGASVVSAKHGEQVAFGLISDHLDDIGKMLALGGELDDGDFAEIAHLDAFGKGFPPGEQRIELFLRISDLFSELAIGDLDSSLAIIHPNPRSGSEYFHDS